MKAVRSAMWLMVLAAPMLTVLAACGNSPDRQDTRQDTRVEGRTEERMEERRD